MTKTLMLGTLSGGFVGLLGILAPAAFQPLATGAGLMLGAALGWLLSTHLIAWQAASRRRRAYRQASAMA